jgi:hypothetical protein
MNEDLINRITYHLSSGGLFNPELSDHLAVRNLLIECREALAQPEQEPVALEALKWIASHDLSGADDRALGLMSYAFVSKARFAVLEATGERA